MARRLRDIDRGYKKLIASMRKVALRPKVVSIGVRAGGPSDLPLIAAVNEFGSSDGRIPERSFLRSTIDENRAKYEGQLSKVIGAVIDGKSTLRAGLNKIGVGVVGDVKRKITALKDPPNAASTIAQKGSDNPLIDTGRLRASIDFEVKNA